jgi:anaerobic ribonucleoside-triphosphate reductase activating protein
MDLHTRKKRETLYIPVAEYLRRSRVNGPGLRSVLWVQGCPFRCPSCFNTKFQEFRTTNLHPVDEVAEWVLSDSETEGVTFSGGEPFAHAEELSSLSKKIQQAGKSIVIFTGYTKLDLRHTKDPFNKKLLEHSDLLITGPYKKDTQERHPLLSSANQELIFQSSRYKEYGFGDGVKRVEYVIKRDGKVSVTGFPFEVR